MTTQHHANSSDATAKEPARNADQEQPTRQRLSTVSGIVAVCIAAWIGAALGELWSGGLIGRAIGGSIGYVLGFIITLMISAVVIGRAEYPEYLTPTLVICVPLFAMSFDRQQTSESEAARLISAFIALSVIYLLGFAIRSWLHRRKIS
jgi:hypothetical protein